MLNTPLNDVEFEQLDEFLLSDETPAEAMDTSMLDGYLAAVSSGPNLVMPSEMLRWVWDAETGEEAAEFNNSHEAETIVGLVVRHYQYVNDALNDRTYIPRIMEREHEGRMVSIIDEWCMGYYVGIAADMAAWAPLLIGRPKLVSTILLYGTKDGWETLKEKSLTADEHEALAESLTESARAIHAFWLERRHEGINRGDAPGIMPSRAPIRNPGKVGRNAACPCGSGKKFKHCHGGSSSSETPTEKSWLH